MSDPGPQRFVLATANPHKVVEIRAILGDGVELVARPDSVPPVDETGDTFVENARLKAVALVDATGLPAIADDSGLEVEALGGAPGVWTSTFAGPSATDDENVDHLLARLDGVDDRRARFRSVALARWPDGRELVCEGTVEGTIAHARSGDGGFGYDPVFVPDGWQRTFASASPDDKHAISHRGRAFRALAEALRNGA